MNERFKGNNVLVKCYLDIVAKLAKWQTREIYVAPHGYGAVLSVCAFGYMIQFDRLTHGYHSTFKLLKMPDLTCLTAHKIHRIEEVQSFGME